MAVRIDIDAQDVKRLRKETGKRFSRQTMMLAVSCATIMLISAGAIFVLWRGLQLLAEARAENTPMTMAIGALALSASLIVFSAFSGVMLVKARRAIYAVNHRDNVKPGLTTGRFEFHFTDKALIVKGAQGTRKINWAGLGRIAETTSMIVFWRRGEIFAFLPKAGLADAAFYEKLVRIHGPAVANKLSSRDDAVTNPHKIKFECTQQDYAEYRRRHADQIDGWLSVFRHVVQWAPWPVILVLLASIAAMVATYSFVATLSVAAGVIAISATLSAAAVFFANAETFRGPAHPGRRDAHWPFSQSEPFSLTLFDGGVCVTRGECEEIYPWTAFEQLAFCPLTTYLVLTPQIVLPAPKRAFTDKVHFQAFCNYARAHMKNAHTQTAARKKARLARQLAPGVKHQSKKKIKALPAPAPARALPRKAPPKALPPSADKTARGALDAVRSAAKARVNVNQAV